MNTLIKSGDNYFFNTQINSYGSKLLVNDKPLVEAMVKGWYVLDEKPTKYTKEITRNVQSGWKLKDSFKDKGFKESLPLNDIVYDNDEELWSELKPLYDPQYKEEVTLEEYEITFDKEIDEDVNDSIAFTGMSSRNYGTPDIVNIVPIPSAVHALLYPNILLPNKPCVISSDDMYKIIRKHVQDNIDPKYAKITSDYDFCFTVKKLLAVEPEKRSYDANALSRSKKIKLVHYVVTDREVQVFEMTPKSQMYRGYSAISGMSAGSHSELKEKVDKLLENIMTIINEPLESCKTCKGTGVLEVKKFVHNA